MPEPHDHQWQDTGFAAVEDCAVPGCEAVRSEPNDKPEREWSYMDRQTGLTGDDVDEQGRLTYTTEAALVASDGPPFDPRMDLPGVPDDWRVLWCPGCGYAVTWDKTFEDETWDDGDLPERAVWEAAQHDCPKQAEASGTAGDEHV